ncbi:Peroxisome chaperone and import receptor [Coemansia thaxteri]|nr:Peroxisome chaperone and import receptor [Coemansia thaxteri]KAJ2470808.1 Peroxisome chaperone and import receptor [Coemansia sp. RSA 2322]
MASATPPPPTDAELDELLDDAFEQFTVATPRPKAKKAPAPTESDGSGAVKAESAEAAPDGVEDEFTRQLAKSMEALLKDSSALTGAEGEGAGGDEMKTALDQLLKQMTSMQADLGVQAPAPADSSTDTPSAEQPSSSSFQNKIKATMDKLKESSDRADADTAAQGAAGDMGMMDELMRQMDQMGDDPQLDSLVDDVISQLMSKDVLQQPLKELDVEYPRYLEKNKDSLSAEDRARYEKQHSYVKQILALFAETTDDAANDPRIVELMQKMQDCGQPPNELLKILAPDMEFDDKGDVKVPEAPPNCSVM